MTISEDPDYDNLPAEIITPDQLVALNMKLYRKAADRTQEQVGELLGWSPANVSAAERSVAEGRDRRRFDASTVTAIAATLGLPIVALYMPPPDDGNGKRYLLRVGEGVTEQLLPMQDVMWLAMHDLGGSHPALEAYRTRLREAYGFYLNPEWSDLLEGWLAANDELKALAVRTEQTRARLQALLDAADAVAEDVGGLTDAIDKISGGAK